MLDSVRGKGDKIVVRREARLPRPARQYPPATPLPSRRVGFDGLTGETWTWGMVRESWKGRGPVILRG